MNRGGPRVLFTAALLLAVLTRVSVPVLAGPSDWLPGDDASSGLAWLADFDSLAGGFGLNRPLEQNPNPPAIHICKLAGQLVAGSLVTLQVSGTHNGGPTTVINTITVGTNCSQNEFTNFGNQFDLNTIVTIQETAPPGTRILPVTG